MNGKKIIVRDKWIPHDPHGACYLCMACDLIPMYSRSHFGGLIAQKIEQNVLLIYTSLAQTITNVFSLITNNQNRDNNRIMTVELSAPMI